MIRQEKEDYYCALEIEVDSHISEVDTSTIKKAFRKLALVYHPDKNQESGGDAVFKLLNRAYETLTDDKRRTEYDSWYQKHYKRSCVTQAHISKGRIKKEKMERAESRRLKEETFIQAQQGEEIKNKEKEREKKAKQRQQREEEVLRRRREEEQRRVAEKLRKEKAEQERKIKEKIRLEQEAKLRQDQQKREANAKKLREEVLKKQHLERQRRKELQKKSEELKKLFGESNRQSSNFQSPPQSAYQFTHTPGQKTEERNFDWSNPQFYASAEPSKPQNQRRFARTKTSRFQQQHISKADFHKKILELREKAEKTHDEREAFTDECEDYGKKAERIETSAKKALDKAVKKYHESLKRADAMDKKAKEAQDSADKAHGKMESYLNEYETLFNKYGHIYGEPSSDDEDNGLDPLKPEDEEEAEEENVEPELQTPKAFKFDFGISESTPPRPNGYKLKSDPWKNFLRQCKGEGRILYGSLPERQAELYIFFQFTSNYQIPSLLLPYCRAKLKFNNTERTQKHISNSLPLHIKDLWRKAVQEALSQETDDI